VIKNDVTKIVKVEKSVTNYAQTYKVQVQTHTEEQATIVMDVNPVTK
jgi:rhamnose utilization protein RhaD (predicted bifunctional aldolase and dehydrogenase)